MSSYSDLGGPIENPEFDLPFTFNEKTGSVNEVEQGSDYDIANRVWTLLSYEPGMLIAQPDFGIPDQAFRINGADLAAIERAVTKYIPDASELISRDPNWFQTLVDRVQISKDPNA